MERKKRQTDIEELLDKAMIIAGIKFSKFYPIRNKWEYEPDFCIVDEKLIIEADGKIWHDKKKWKDKKRDEFFNNLGWKTIRFSDDEIKNNIQGCIKKIWSEIYGRREICNRN